MLPKEKAEELALKFCISLDSVKPNKISINQALKCCDEMLNNAGFIWGGRNTETGLSARDSFREYWTEVKEELLKM